MAPAWFGWPCAPGAIRPGSSTGWSCAKFACRWAARAIEPTSCACGPVWDPHSAPALELAKLYARRWDHELYFREVKRQLRKTDLLQSHTVETGAQEIAALVLASALLATERARAADGKVPVLTVSFGHVLNVVRGMWLFFGPFDDLVNDRLKQRVVRRGNTLMRRSLTAERRSRSCPRAVRQTVKAWPRLLQTQSVEGPMHFKLA